MFAPIDLVALLDHLGKQENECADLLLRAYKSDTPASVVKLFETNLDNATDRYKSVFDLVEALTENGGTAPSDPPLFQNIKLASFQKPVTFGDVNAPTGEVVDGKDETEVCKNEPAN